MEYTVDELAIKKITIEIKNEKKNIYKNAMEHLQDNMSEKSKRLLQQVDRRVYLTDSPCSPLLSMVLNCQRKTLGILSV